MRLEEARKLSRTDKYGALCARAALINHCDENFDMVVEALEDARAFALRFDELDDCEMEFGRRMNEVLARAKEVKT
jgi:hypothetical protein